VLPIGKIGFGGMPLSIQGRPPEEQGRRVIQAVIDAGVNFIDTADVYCLDDNDIGHNERLIASVLRERDDRDRILVATKGGLRRPKGAWTNDGSPKHIREACERIGRDPQSIRIAQCVITAPDLDEVETRQVAHGRAVTYLQAPGYRDALLAVNGWDPEIVRRLAAHELFRGTEVIADNRFHRSELLGPAALIPDEWMEDSCALGSVPECVQSLQRFRDAGADEIVTYGSTPGQNAELARAWTAAGAMEGSRR